MALSGAILEVDRSSLERVTDNKEFNKMRTKMYLQYGIEIDEYGVITGCSELLDMDLLVLQEGITAIENNAFKGCRFNVVKMPQSMQQIFYSSFYNVNKIVLLVDKSSEADMKRAKSIKRYLDFSIKYTVEFEDISENEPVETE